MDCCTAATRGEQTANAAAPPARACAQFRDPVKVLVDNRATAHGQVMDGSTRCIRARGRRASLQARCRVHVFEQIEQARRVLAASSFAIGRRKDLRISRIGLDGSLRHARCDQGAAKRITGHASCNAHAHTVVTTRISDSML